MLLSHKIIILLRRKLPKRILIMLKVKLISNDGRNIDFNCQFRSDKTLEKFLNRYSFYGGTLNFNYDVIDEHKQSFGLPTIQANHNGWNLVVKKLF